MQNRIANCILSTIVYYDILDYPLTAFEIWKYLLKSQKIEVESQNEMQSCETCSLLDIMRGLEGDGLKNEVESFNGFYFLKGRKELVNKRIERNKISEKKFKIIRWVAFWLRFVPYVRMIAATGRVAMKNAGKKSDLDLFIVLEKKRIFTGRILVTLLVQFMGKRRYGRKISDRICLNYFIASDSLEISVKDLFASSEYFFMVPLFGAEIFRMFQAENSWIKNYHINFQPTSVGNLKILPDNFSARFIRWLGERIFGFDLIEEKLKKWQLGRIENDPRTHQIGSMVMADDKALVFLPNPQGPKIFEKFREKIEQFD